MIKPKFYGVVKRGKFVPERPEQRDAYLAGLEGRVVEEVIARKQDSKTLNQLAYFHGVICFLASEASGYTAKEVKGLLKEQFLRRYVETAKGEVGYTPSLADLKKEEMSKFIDDCIILCAGHWHCVIPPPETVSLE